MKRTLSSQKSLYTTEDPWVRYADPVAGDDANDGKTAGTAWRTLAKLKAETPRVGGLKFWKLGIGTFSESLVLNKGLGSLCVVGSWEETYTLMTFVSITNPGTTTVEGWAELVLDYSAQPGFVIDDTLLDMHVEYNSTVQSWRNRLKIIGYTDLGGGRIRLLVDGVLLPFSGIPNILVVREGTIIDYDGGELATVTVLADDECRLQPAWNVANLSGIVLHALKIIGNKLALRTAVGSWAQIGSITTLVDGANGRAFDCAGAMYQMIAPRALSSALKALLDNRVHNVNSNISSFGINTIDTAVSGKVWFVSFYSFNSNQFYIANPDNNAYINSIYKTTHDVVMVGDGHESMSFYGRATLGRCLRVNSHGSGRCTLQLGSNFVTNKIGFRGVPESTNGRIYLDNCVLISPRIIDLGDVTGHVATVPLVTVTKNSSMRCAGLTAGASGSECPAAAPIIKVDKGGKAHFEGAVTLWHGSDAVQPATQSIVVDNDSEFIMESGNLTINAKTAPGAPTGIVQVEYGSKFHFVSSIHKIDINHSVGATGGYNIFVDEATFICEGATDIDSTLIGNSIFCSNSRVRLNGAISGAIAGYPLMVDGERADFRAGSTFIHSTCRAGLPPFRIQNMARAFFGDNVQVPTQDYGANTGVFYIDNGSKVQWWAQVTDGDATFNRNSNAAGYGVNLKRGAQLIKSAVAGGPDGALGDMSLGGAAGATAYPAASGNSINDIVNGTESAAQLAACHVM